MKIFIISARRWLGPKTPYVGIVKEEDENKAIEAFMDPTAFPFAKDDPVHFRWYARYKPSTEDFIAKCIGYDNTWPIRFPGELRSSALEMAPIKSSEETAFLLFLQDRIIIRLFTDGSSIASFLFEFKLAMADFFYSVAQMIGDKSKHKKDLAELKE